MFTITSLHSSGANSSLSGLSVMKEKRKSSGWTRWWLSVGCCALVVTLTFVAATVYLGAGPHFPPPTRPPPPATFDYPTDRFGLPRKNSKAIIEMVSLDEATPAPEAADKFPKIPAEFETTEVDFKVPPAERKVLPSGKESLEELYENLATAKEGQTKKKSEAVFPATGWLDPEMRGEPVIVDPENHFKPADFALPGFGPSLEASSTDSPRKEENALADMASERLKEVYDLMGAATGGQWAGVLEAVNDSVSRRNATDALKRLEDIYYEDSEGDSSPPSLSSLIYPPRVNDTSSLLSFGMLAVDLFLLHNVQQIALREDTSAAGKEMMNDPEVVALNTLFVAPEKARELARTNSRYIQDKEDNAGFQDLLEIFEGFVRAAINMFKAYTTNTSGRSAPGSRSSAVPSTLDCLWTLYCRNLDKTAKLEGPYGLLAKVNGFGLRLMMGEFPAEAAPEKLVSEVASGWTSLDCRKLFPRCGAEEAKEVVLATALRENLV